MGYCDNCKTCGFFYDVSRNDLCPKCVVTAAEADEIKSYHGCLSGDCPHETQPECDIALAAHRFAVHWSKPSPPPEAIDALEHAFRTGAAWQRTRVLDKISYPCECGYADELRKETSDVSQLNNDNSERKNK